jgi:hypothetical protein
VEPDWGERVYFYYVIRLDRRVLGADMLSFACALAAEGVYDLGYISTTRWIIPQHLEPVFVNKVGYGGKSCPFDCKYYDGHVEYGPGLCPVAEQACDEVFWLASVHPLLERQDLDDVAEAVIKVATAFAEKTAQGLPHDYGTPELRARL